MKPYKIIKTNNVCYRQLVVASITPKKIPLKLFKKTNKSFNEIKFKII